MMRMMLVAVLLMCPGCAAIPGFQAYSAPALPPEELARIVVLPDTARQARPGGAPALHISCVDGESTSTSLITVRYPTEVFVTPGLHYIGVRYNYLNASSQAVLSLAAHAGRTYTLQTIAHGYDIGYVLADSATGRPVGGVVRGGALPGRRSCGPRPDP